MKFKKESIHRHFNRDIYWTRLIVLSDDNMNSTNVLFCVSEEFLIEFFHTIEISPNQINQWFEDTLKSFMADINTSIYNEKFHYKVFATTLEGKNNGLDFLQNEIIPNISNTDFNL